MLPQQSLRPDPIEVGEVNINGWLGNMPQQISETSDRHKSKDGVSGTEERAECT